jgi:Glycosyl transferase family 2
VKLVMTLVVRDEADILEAHLGYHLSAGVDFVIATDHRSRDGSTEILESYERAGVLRRIAEEGEFTRQGAWQTRMARLAATEHGADWVINSDADEFWWPRGASLKDALGSVSLRYGVVRGLVRNFVPRRAAADGFPDGLTVRLATSAPINDPATPFRPVVKAAHRGDQAVVVGEGGSHQVYGVSGALLRDWYPLEVLHFPLRTREQCARKYYKTWSGWEENLRGDLTRAREASAKGDPDAVWDRVALDDSEVERGLADSSLVSDVRIRDAVRLVRNESVASSAREDSPPPTRAELDAHALEVTVFEEAELIRCQRWADELNARVSRLGRTTRTPVSS